MITQNLHRHAQTEVFASFHTGVDGLVRKVTGRIKAYRENRERRELYAYYQKFTNKQLQDIGMGNPQDQLRVMGCYLKTGKSILANCRFGL